MIITCITAFNGLELLPKCVDNFLKFSDKVLISYQDVSHVGERRDVGSFIYKNFANTPNVIITKFEPKSSTWNFKDNERDKHTQMLDDARKLGADYAIIAAVDHFYDEKQVASILYKALQYDVTFTAVDQYYKYPTWQITPKVDFYMPFTIKLYPHTKVTKVPNYPLPVDPACKINTTDTWHLFNEDEIVVHNYGMIRNDIREKYKNRYIPLKWSTKKIARLINEYETYDIETNVGIEHYHGKKIKIVPNYFDL